MFGCPPGAVGARRFARLCRAAPGCANGLDPLQKSLLGDIEAWSPEASMPGCRQQWLAGWLGWLARLARLPGWLGWLGWLAGWLAKSGLAGWLAAAEGLLLSEVPHARRFRRSAGSQLFAKEYL